MRSSALAVVSSVLLLAGCGPSTYADAQVLYDAAGGEEWCGGELTFSVEPFIGRCGEGDDRVVLGVHPADGELFNSIRTADDGLLIVVPTEPGRLPAWQLRSQDRAALEVAAERLGGELLEDQDEIDAWVDDQPVPEPTDGETEAAA